MPLLPTLVGGLEVRERPPRYHGQPRYKRIDFVRSHAEKEDYELVKTIYKLPEHHHHKHKAEKKHKKQKSESGDEPLMTVHQWNHHHQQQQEAQRQHQLRQQQQQHMMQQQRQREQYEAHQRWLQQEQMRREFMMRQQHGQQQHGHHGHHGHHQQPPPPPMHHPQADPVGFAQPMRLTNQHGLGINDFIDVVSSDSSSDEEEMAYAVHKIKPSRGHRSRPVSLIDPDDIYPSSSEDERPRSRHSRHRY